MPRAEDDAEECAEKHCGQPPTVGMTIRYGDLRIEIYLCERHFDALSDWFMEYERERLSDDD